MSHRSPGTSHSAQAIRLDNMVGARHTTAALPRSACCVFSADELHSMVHGPRARLRHCMRHFGR
eukprot:5497138-Prymnesium_polylepis.2